MTLCQTQAPRKIESALVTDRAPARVKPPAAVPKDRAHVAGSGGKLYRQGGNLPFFRRLPFHPW